MTEVDGTTFDAVVLKSEKPVLVDFSATWCGPCRAMEPALKTVAADNKDNVLVVKVNVDDAADLCTKYGVRAVPTLVLFKNGEIVQQRTGALSRKDLQAFIDGELK